MFSQHITLLKHFFNSALLTLQHIKIPLSQSQQLPNQGQHCQYHHQLSCVCWEHCICTEKTDDDKNKIEADIWRIKAIACVHFEEIFQFCECDIDALFITASVSEFLQLMKLYRSYFFSFTHYLYLLFSPSLNLSLPQHPHSKDRSKTHIVKCSPMHCSLNHLNSHIHPQHSCIICLQQHLQQTNCV